MDMRTKLDDTMKDLRKTIRLLKTVAAPSVELDATQLETMEREVRGSHMDIELLLRLVSYWEKRFLGFPKYAGSPIYLK